MIEDPASANPIAPLEKCVTPRQIADAWAAAGIHVSERELRARIRQLGCYRTIGKAVFLTPDDVVALLEGLKPKARGAWAETPDVDRVTVGDALALIETTERVRRGKRPR